ncbi:hypothetical protein [Cryobacterium zhongshanensis]|uniref:Uncharacterized protein n=1 Tax=Cryobacterium zhongshanensis TaxID=2928153 RepID=A0AA41QXQ6_9MICO|nr:hypothetical protein [Cryobacterium zhongshanensis]MCI4659591.1 hypothetical protein [Cryobacterium zhongshanensis]
MADLRKETHGPGSMKGVHLAVIAYDNRVAKKDDVVTTHYLDARIHPGDHRAAGQTTLALVSKKDAKSPTGYNNSARYSAGQFEAIKEAAGTNVTDLTNKEGTVVGKIYGVKADLLISNGDVIANTKTLEASELSVGDDAAGKDIRTQIFDSMKEAKDARAAAAPEAAAVEAPAAEVAPVEVAPAAEKPAAKAKAARKPKAAVKPELVSVGAETAVSSDEPELG